MNKTLICLGSLLVSATPALAHSDGGSKQIGPKGQYRGPVDEVVAAFSAGPGPGGAMAPGGSTEDMYEGYERWEFWWEINKDVLLHSLDGTRSDYLGSQQGVAVGLRGERVDERSVREQILPTLLGLLGKPMDRDLRAATLAALGRLGVVEAVEELIAATTKGSAEERRQAVLALGQIDHPRAMMGVLQVFRNETERPELRAEAAIALGLHGKREIMRILAAELEVQATPGRLFGEREQLITAIVTSLGLGESSSRAVSVPLLSLKYEELGRLESRSRSVRVAILAALGKLGDAAALPTLIHAVKDSDVEISRSAALALGELAAKEAAPHLIALISDGSGDLQTKGFACIALGRIGTPEALEALRAQIGSRRSRAVPSFAALGLGLARDHASAPALREVLERKSEDQLRGAFALALGMLRDQASTEMLFEILEKGTCDEDLRGYAAVALGMIRPLGGFERMMRFVEHDRSRLEGVHRGLLLAMGLWEDMRATDYLVSALHEESRESLRANAVHALSIQRSRGAIESLQELLTLKTTARTNPDLKMYAVAALGALGQKSTIPLYARAFYSVNYRMRSPMMESLMQQI